MSAEHVICRTVACSMAMTLVFAAPTFSQLPDPDPVRTYKEIMKRDPKTLGLAERDLVELTAGTMHLRKDAKKEFDLYRVLLAIEERVEGVNNPELIDILENLACLSDVLKRPTDAKKYRNRIKQIMSVCSAQPTLKEFARSDPPARFPASNDDKVLDGIRKGTVFAERADYKTALKYFQLANAKLEPLTPWQSRVDLWTRLGDALVRNGKFLQAQQIYTKLQELHAQHEKHLQLSYDFNALGNLAMINGDFVAAKAYFNRALSVPSNWAGVPDQHELARQGLGYIQLSEQKKLSQAELSANVIRKWQKAPL